MEEDINLDCDMIVLLRAEVQTIKEGAFVQDKIVSRATLHMILCERERETTQRVREKIGQ